MSAPTSASFGIVDRSLYLPPQKRQNIIQEPEIGCRRSHRQQTTDEPEQVAKDALQGIEQETFVILPHPQVLGYMRKKTENYDRWIAGMAKIQARMREDYGK